jgi:hypothetical protein
LDPAKIDPTWLWFTRKWATWDAQNLNGWDYSGNKQQKTYQKHKNDQTRTSGIEERKTGTLLPSQSQKHAKSH